jgi:hypothetical protein
LALALAQDHDWTEQGTRPIIDLANNYSSFMLKNALTLIKNLGFFTCNPLKIMVT